MAKKLYHREAHQIPEVMQQKALHISYGEAV